MNHAEGNVVKLAECGKVFLYKENCSAVLRAGLGISRK